MSNQLDDFLISLGFDTKKLDAQIKKIKKELSEVMDGTPILGKPNSKPRQAMHKEMNAHVVAFQKAQNKKDKIVSNSTKHKISDEQLVQRAIEDRQKKELKREEDLAKIRNKNNGTSAGMPASHKRIVSAIRMQEIRAITNKEANPQLEAMGNHYRQMQSSGIGTKLLRRRQRRDVNTFRNTQAFQNLSGFAKGSEERNLLAKILIQARQDSKANKKERLTRSRAKLVKMGNEYEKRGRFSSNMAEVSSYSRMQAASISNQIDPRFADGLRKQLDKAKTKTDVDRTIGTVSRISRMKGADANIVANAQNVEQLKRYGEQLKRNNAELNAAARRSFGLAAAQGSLRDSTRNLVREYASLYAIFAGTMAIKESAKAMDGVVAGMTAVSANSVELAHNMKFIKEESLKNGLAVGEAAKAYVKLKAAIGDKKSLEETEQMFQSLTKAGVVFQLSQDDMSGVIKAVSQMFAKGKIQAKFFGLLSRNG